MSVLRSFFRRAHRPATPSLPAQPAPQAQAPQPAPPQSPSRPPQPAAPQTARKPAAVSAPVPAPRTPRPTPTPAPVAAPAPAPASVPTAAGAFAELLPALQKALAEEQYVLPTPIQEQAIPPLLAGRDLLGCAQTGTGKTAAFTLPMLQGLHLRPRRVAPGRPRALILAPTRELAAQIGESLRAYGRHLRLPHTVIFGGVGQGPQVQALRRGAAIVVATPGRLLDLMQQGHIKLEAVEVFVLDEADRMLDMGFIPDIRRIIATLPSRRQSLFFSATLAPEVGSLATSMLQDPVRISVAPEQPTVERIAQKVLFVDKPNKDKLLATLLRAGAIDKVLIFAQTKHGADKVARKLLEADIEVAAIHGGKSQGVRTRVLDGFRSGQIRALVATDIAARGIDIDGITHVINYDLPNLPETYIHRIGRTARAGADGDAISFCSAEERDYLREIERLIRKRVPVDQSHEWHSEGARTATGAAARPPPKHGRGGGRAQASGKRSAAPGQGAHAPRPAASHGGRTPQSWHSPRGRSNRRSGGGHPQSASATA